MRRQWLLRLVALGLTCCAVCDARARTWHIKVDQTGDAPTIQAGVDSAAGGDTVLVAPGTYTDGHEVLVDGVLTIVVVHVYKNLALVAEEGSATTTIDGSKANIAVFLENVNDTAEIRGFSISTAPEGYGCIDAYGNAGPPRRWTETQLEFQVGIRCESSPPVIRDNHLLNNGIGVLLRSSSAALVGNEIHGSFFGVVAEQLSDATIENNKLYDCAALLHIENSSPVVQNNEFYSQGDDVCDAIVVSGSSAQILTNRIQGAYVNGINMGNALATVEDNLLLNNGRGIMVTGGSPKIQLNRFVDNGCCVEFAGSLGSQFVNNTMFGFATGVFCQAGSTPLIRRNILNNGSDGIHCRLFAVPIIECNDVFDVTTPYGGECSDQTGVNGNFSRDPEFCGIDYSGNYFLQSDSPCAPGNHPGGDDCGLIGALPVNCGKVGVERRSWGTIKSLYKRDG